MEEKLDAVVEKLRRLFSFGMYKEVIEQDPEVTLWKVDGKWEIYSIRFAFYDEISVGYSGVWYRPEHGDSKQLIGFKGFDDFLSI